MKLHTISRARGLAWAAENIRYHASPGLTLSCRTDRQTVGKMIQCRNYQGKKNTKIVIADLSLHFCLVLQSTIALFTSHTQVFATRGMKLFPVTTNNASYYNASHHNYYLRNCQGCIELPKTVRGHATYIDGKMLNKAFKCISGNSRAMFFARTAEHQLRSLYCYGQQCCRSSGKPRQSSWMCCQPCTLYRGLYGQD